MYFFEVWSMWLIVFFASFDDVKGTRPVPVVVWWGFGSRRKSEKVENENLIYEVSFIFKLYKIERRK